MTINSIRNAVIASAVSASLLMVSGSAQALTVKGSTTESLIHVNKPKRDADLILRSSDGRSVLPLIDAGETVADLQAGATGQGDTQEECDDRIRLAILWTDLAGAAIANGDWDSASQAFDNADEEIEGALDNGCFVVESAREDPPPDEEPPPVIG